MQRRFILPTDAPSPHHHAAGAAHRQNPKGKQIFGTFPILLPPALCSHLQIRFTRLILGQSCLIQPKDLSVRWVFRHTLAGVGPQHLSQHLQIKNKHIQMTTQSSAFSRLLMIKVAAVTFAGKN